MIPRCFWDVVCTTLLSAIKCYLVLLLLSASGGCDIALDFRLKMASSACFFWIWVEDHFPLEHLSIYLFQVAIQFKSRGIAIMDYRKQGRIINK